MSFQSLLRALNFLRAEQVDLDHFTATITKLLGLSVRITSASAQVQTLETIDWIQFSDPIHLPILTRSSLQAGFDWLANGDKGEYKCCAAYFFPFKNQPVSFR